jgi:hypothetical protein
VRFATFAVASLKLFLHRVKVRKPFRRTYLVAIIGLQAWPGRFNRLNLPAHVAPRKDRRALPNSAPRCNSRAACARNRHPNPSPVDINHVAEGVTGIRPLAINKA